MKRGFLIALAAIFVIFFSTEQVGDMLLPWKPFGSYGFSATSFGNITSVRADSPAARAGIEAGDSVDLSGLTYHQRRRLIYLSLSPPGETLSIPITHNGTTRQVTLTSAVYSRTTAENVSDVIETAERLVLLAIAIVLAVRLPSVLMCSFFLIAVGSSGGANVHALASDALMKVYMPVCNAAVIAGCCASVVFAMLFPRLVPSRRESILILALSAFGLLWFLVDLATGFETQFQWSGTASLATLSFVNRLNGVLLASTYIASVAAFVINYLRSTSAERLRMQWVALGFAIGSLGTIGTIVFVTATGIQLPLWLQNLVLSLNIFIPITVAYAILKHHVIDIRFFLSRALVYSAISGVAVVTLVLLEVLVAKQLEEYHLALIVEISGALAVGIGMQRLHKTIDRLVDRYVFRSIHTAERHLGEIGDAMMYARTPEQIDEMLSMQAERALDLVSVSVIRTIGDDDQLALRLHASRSAIDDGSDVAIGFTIRHRLYGYARFGPHRNGAAIDPNERSILHHLCHRAAMAYDHVTSEERLAENERLRIENSVLRSLVGNAEAVPKLS